MPLGRPGHAAAEETARRATGSASRGRPGAAVDAGQAGGSAEGQREAPVSAAQNAEVDWDAIFRTIGDQSVPTNEAGQGHRYSEGTVSRAYDLPEHLGPGGSSLLPRRGPERGQGGLSRASGAWPADFLSSDPSGNGLMSPFATGAAQGPVPSSRGGTPPRGPLHRSSSYPFHQDPFSFDQPNDHLSRSRGFPSEPSGSFDMPPPPPPLQHLAGYSEPMSFASSSSSAASSQHNLHTQLAAYTSTPLASPAQEAWDYMSRWGGGGHANQAEAEPSGRRHTLSHAQSAQPGGQVSQTVSPAATPLSNPASGEDSEDKRVRNTVASAKFRAKKKAQVANVQRTITDLESQQASLEADVASLKRENGLLREMVQLKFGTKISDN